jgi:uncharacterized C2H2 Zn-finger protein
MKQTHVYKIDLTRINGDGAFRCPRCGTTISPDDDTEDSHSVAEPKVNSQGLKEVIIRCNRCASHIHLTGFSFLQKTSKTHEKKYANQEKMS